MAIGGLGGLGGGQQMGGMGGMGGGAALGAAQQAAQVQDQNAAQLTAMQTQMDTKKTQLEMVKMQRDFKTTQTKLHQEASIHASKTASSMNKQFGQVIGAFQALGHRAAELYTEMELARSAVEGALAAIDAPFFEAIVTANLRFAPRAVLQEMGVDRADYWLVYELLLDAQQRIMNLLCGLNRRIPPGKIKGMDASLAGLAIAPADVVARLRQLWLLPPDTAVAALLALELEMLDLVDAHMPQVDTAPLRQRLDYVLRQAPVNDGGGSD